jgi:hypothetical protein
MVTAAAGCRPCRRAGPDNSSLRGRGVRALPQGAPGPRACEGTVIYRSARTRRGAQVSAARRGKEAGPGAPADPDDARAERWPGVADFGDLVRRYRRELHVYCYRMLGSFDEAEDHVQEMFLSTWRARERFQGQSSPRTWLYRVATNACLDTLRRDARRAVPAPSSAALRVRATCGSGRTGSCLHRNQRAGRCRSRACPHHAPRSRKGEPCWRDDERRSPSPARAWTQPAGAAAGVLEQPTLHLVVTFPCHIQDDNGTRGPADHVLCDGPGEPGVRDCGVPCANSGGSYLGSPSRFPPIARPNEGILVHRLRFRLL